MKKAYLLVYSDLTGSRDVIKAWANSSKIISTWRYDLPNCFYIISESDAAELSKSLRSYTGNKGRFIFSEITENRNGWLPPDTWYLLKHKKSKPKE